MQTGFDVIVIGGGHAGCEAALAAARLGAKALLITMNLDRIGHISCNPAVGGIGKGQLVREVDALGGMMGKAADAAAIQYRMLNSGKGAAVRSPRAQIDRWIYQSWVKKYVENHPGVSILQDRVQELLVESGSVNGVRAALSGAIHCRSVVVCSGTFARARLHCGLASWPGGRADEPPANELSESLLRHGVPLFRLRTDTCPRIDARTADLAAMRIEPGDDKPQPFSFEAQPTALEQVPCYSTWTTEETFRIVESVLAESPAITGAVGGEAPRYCPNIELKVARFPEKRSHHIFVEPEGRSSGEMYLNGLSTSIPPQAQIRMVQSIPGLEQARIVRYGYAVEYDAVRPESMRETFESKIVKGLFTAGQVNGTSGYEEAAGQGLLAGTNAALGALGQPPFTLGRDEAYLGVMADDLTTRSIDEPYRMFTSRAEYRLFLRQDNADLRLSRRGAEIGLVGRERAEMAENLAQAVQRGKNYLEKTFNSDGASLAQVLRRPESTWRDVADRFPEAFDQRAAEQIEIEVKYSGYAVRQAAQKRLLEKARSQAIPSDFDFAALEGLSREAKEKMTRFRPATMDQAMRLAGVTPSDAALLALRLGLRG